MLHVRLPESTKKETRFTVSLPRLWITGNSTAIPSSLGFPGFAGKGGAHEKPGENPWISWQRWKILGSYRIPYDFTREIPLKYINLSPWETVMFLKTELIQYYSLVHPACLCKGTRNIGYMFLSLPLTWLFFHSKSNPLRSKCPQRTNKMAVP